MKEIKESIEWTLKVYSLTTVIPITMTIINVVFCGLLGIETIYGGFWMNLKVIWVDYYLTGIFLDIEAWRWQLGLLFFSFLFTKFAD